jgi:hypothetical protein
VFDGKPCAAAPRRSRILFPRPSNEIIAIGANDELRVATALGLAESSEAAFFITLIQHASSQDAAISVDLPASSLDRRTASTSNAD